MLFRATRRAACVLLLGLVIACLLLVSTAAWAQASAADAQTQYTQALEFLQNGKFTDALQVVDTAIAAGAHDPALYNLKGLAASELGRNREAEESFRSVIRLAPQSAMGYNNLGILLSKSGRHREAANAFREALVLDPRDFTTLLGLGTSLAALGEYAQAATYLQKAWQVRTGDFEAGYQWALALHEAKQAVAAQKVLNQITAPQEPGLAAKYDSLAGVVAEDLKDFAAAARFYGQAYAASRGSANSGSYEIYFALVRAILSAGGSISSADLPSPPENLSPEQDLALGGLLASHGAYDAAIPRFEDVLKTDASNQTAMMGLALAYKNAGRSADAVGLLQHWLQDKPSAALYNMLAGFEEDSGQFVEAVKNYQRAVELEPSNEEYYFDLGMEYLSHFTFGPAAEVFRVGVQKFPHSSRQFLGLAFSHYAVREYKDAADNFTTALEIAPDSQPVFVAWKTVLSFLAPKDWEKLLPRLAALANAHPQSAGIAFCYGAALFRSEFAKGAQGALERPQALLEKAVRLRPDFPEAHLELGSLYAARKQDQKAVDEFLKTIEQNPKSDVAHYKLGQVYRGMNKLDLATQELARYRELSQQHEEELKRSRSAIKQFVLSQPAKSN